MVDFNEFNYFNGEHYIPTTNQIFNSYRPETEICRLIEKCLNPLELAVDIAIEDCRDNNYIDTVEYNKRTVHWIPAEEKKAIEGLVTKGVLKKIDKHKIRRMAPYKNSSENAIRNSFWSKSLKIYNQLDYMSQFAFGFYVACFGFNKDRIIDPIEFQQFTNWEDLTIYRGFETLEKYGFVKKAYRYDYSYPDDAKPYGYWHVCTENGLYP